MNATYEHPYLDISVEVCADGTAWLVIGDECEVDDMPMDGDVIAIGDALYSAYVDECDIGRSSVLYRTDDDIPDWGAWWTVADDHDIPPGSGH